LRLIFYVSTPCVVALFFACFFLLAKNMSRKQLHFGHYGRINNITPRKSFLFCLLFSFSKEKSKGDAKQDHTPKDRIRAQTRPLANLLSPGLLAAHHPYHLMLLGSPPDMVHEG